MFEAALARPTPLGSMKPNARRSAARAGPRRRRACASRSRPQRMKNIDAFEPIASTPSSDDQRRPSPLSRSPEKTSMVTRRTLERAVRSSAEPRRRLARRAVEVTPFDETGDVDEFVASARAPRRGCRGRRRSEGAAISSVSPFLHRRHGLEGLHDRPRALLETSHGVQLWTSPRRRPSSLRLSASISAGRRAF